MSAGGVSDRNWAEAIARAKDAHAQGRKLREGKPVAFPAPLRPRSKGKSVLGLCRSCWKLWLKDGKATLCGAAATAFERTVLCELPHGYEGPHHGHVDEVRTTGSYHLQGPTSYDWVAEPTNG